MDTASFVFESRDPRQTLAFEELEARPAAGADKRNIIAKTGLLDRLDRIASADDRDSVLVLGDRFRYRE